MAMKTHPNKKSKHNACSLYTRHISSRDDDVEAENCTGHPEDSTPRPRRPNCCDLIVIVILIPKLEKGGISK